MLTKEENLKLLNKRILELNLKSKVVLSFDFDELAVPIHLTREITQKISKPINKKLLEKLGPCSFEGITYLSSLIWGYNFKEYKKIRDKLVKETKWTTGFDRLIMKLTKDYSVVFISSGMKDICESKLKEIDFDSRNIIADEFGFDNHKISKTNLIISDELKGHIIKELKKNHKVIGIGHSLGDKTMLDNSDVSISVNSKIPDLAQFNVKSVNELLKVIKKNGPEGI